MLSQTRQEEGKMQVNIPCRLSYQETCTKEKKMEKWKQVRSAMELQLHRKASPPHSRRVDSLREMEINNISDIFTRKNWGSKYYSLFYSFLCEVTEDKSRHRGHMVLACAPTILGPVVQSPIKLILG